MRNRVPGVLAGLASIGLMASAVPAAATAAPGSLDPSFGSGGKVLANLGSPSDAVLQPNGAIVVSLGSGFAVARFLPNGSLDSSFGPGGVAQVTPPPTVAAPGGGTSGLTLQPDGKIIVVGGVPNASTGAAEIGVARFNADGSADQSFGSGGLVATEVLAPGQPSVSEAASTVAVQGDGKILVGASALVAGYRSSKTTGSVVRYNPNGSLDQSFGSGGIVASDLLNGVRTLGVDASGDVFVLPANRELNPSGQIDATVTQAPIVVSSHGGPNQFLPNGQYLAAQSVGVMRGDVDVRAQRFNATGTVDSAFASPLIDYTGRDGKDGAGSIGVEPNGRVVLGGSLFFATAVFGLARVNADGTVDPTFGTGGAVTTTFHGNEAVGTILIQPDAKIVAVGYSENNSTGEVDVALARYLP